MSDLSHLRLAARLYNSALLITPGKAEVIEQVFRAREEGRPALLAPAVEPAQPRQEMLSNGTVRTEAGYYRTAEGIALIPVLGTLVQRGDSMDALSGLTSYGRLASQLQAAMDDTRVGGILLEIDSPGGEANGAFDLQGKIRAAAAKKPTWAIANEQAFSAAYLLASGAERMFVPAPGMVGSVGVVMLHVDQSQRDAKQGLVYTPIFAGSHKVDFSSHAPLSEDALASAQSEVDRVYEMFVGAVADGRGIDAQVVRDTQAALLNPAAALTAGLIDGIQGFDETLAQLAAEVQHVRFNGMRPSARPTAGPTPGEIEMADPMFTAAQMAEAKAAAKAEGVAEGKATAAAEAAAKAPKDPPADPAAVAKAAVEADRKRVVAIQSCEAAKGKPALASHLALETDMTIEQATALLAKAAVEVPAKTNALDAALRGTNPKVAADAGEADDKPKARIDANKIYESRRLAAVK